MTIKEIRRECSNIATEIAQTYVNVCFERVSYEEAYTELIEIPNKLKKLRDDIFNYNRQHNLYALASVGHNVINSMLWRIQDKEFEGSRFSNETKWKWVVWAISDAYNDLIRLSTDLELGLEVYDEPLFDLYKGR